MSVTYVTLAITGKHSKKSIFLILEPVMLLARQAFAVITTQNRKPNSIQDLPHAFTTFNTANVCANDSSWNEPPLATKAKARPSLGEIRALQLFPKHNNNEMEGDSQNP